MSLQKIVRKIKREDGFTLVELLIVVAIIAILAAIAIPQFSAYRKRGYAATVNSDAKNAYTATMAHIADDPALVSMGTECTEQASAGYQASQGVTCSMAFTDIGSFLVYAKGLDAWGLGTSTATINSLGTLTKARP